MWVYAVWVEGSLLLSFCVFLCDAQRKVTSRVENCPNLFSFSLWRLNLRVINQYLLSPYYVPGIILDSGQ